MSTLVDSYGREFVYLRLSLTDRCNFRCSYCLPNGYQRCLRKQQSELSVDEIRRLVQAFASLGIWKIRLTGGEPTLRKDIVEIAAAIAEIPGIREVSLTTNGYRLATLAASLKKAGLTSINISVDSLDQTLFKKITGMNRHIQVLEGIESSLRVGFERVKINTVFLRESVEAGEIERFTEWVRMRPISVRFIELMRTRENQVFFLRQYLPAELLRKKLLNAGWLPTLRRDGDGPATLYTHPSSVGSLGVIAPYSIDFCKTCNRLRLSSRGALRLCLFGDGDVSLRAYLQNDQSHDALVERIRSLILQKPISHRLEEGNYGSTSNLSAIGG